MRSVVVSFIVALALGHSSAASAVNCDQVRRYLSTGRSVDDVAETMIVSVDDVKKCQAGGPAAGQPAGQPAGTGQPAAQKAMPDAKPHDKQK